MADSDEPDVDHHADRGGPPPDDDGAEVVPFAIARDFWHDDYMQGAQFLTHVAAVAQMNDHYPHQVTLERTLSSREKAWKVRTRVVCRTLVLGGLSHHDYFLATLLDVESERPEVKHLLSK
jgi:pterin-4a-carbinolamine dehydratase